jgi:hypothetical protein
MMAPDDDQLAAALVEWLEANASHGLFVTDVLLQIRSWNGWLVAATGLPRTAVIGRSLFEVFRRSSSVAWISTIPRH